MTTTGGRLAGRCAVVTGGGRGIGRAVALAMAGEGAQVLVLGRSDPDLVQTVELCVQRGGAAWHRGCDVRRDQDLQDAVAAALERWGRIDVLVNNAGIDDDTPFLDIDPARWREVVEVNLTAVFRLSQLVARQMRSAGGGVLLHTASVDAQGADGPYAAYNATKSGLLGLSRTMAVELAAYGIRSNCVSPGVTRTEMTAKAVGPHLLDHLENRFDRVPLRRLVRVEEVAAAFVFLASREAAAITGTDLVVDGGLTANLYVLETLPPADGQVTAAP